MSEDRLAGLDLMHIHNDMEIDIYIQWTCIREQVLLSPRPTCNIYKWSIPDKSDLSERINRLQNCWWIWISYPVEEGISHEPDVETMGNEEAVVTHENVKKPRPH